MADSVCVRTGKRALIGGRASRGNGRPFRPLAVLVPGLYHVWESCGPRPTGFLRHSSSRSCADATSVLHQSCRWGSWAGSEVTACAPGDPSRPPRPRRRQQDKNGCGQRPCSDVPLIPENPFGLSLSPFGFRPYRPELGMPFARCDAHYHSLATSVTSTRFVTGDGRLGYTADPHPRGLPVRGDPGSSG